MSKKIDVKSNSAMNYKGKVEIKILEGKKVISSKTIHNKGKWPLFLFFAQCLTGKYSIAEQQRPSYIQLFNINNLDESVLFSDTTWEQRTYPIKVSTSPGVDYTQTTTQSQVESARGVFKFTIPFTLITDTSNVNLMTLKSPSNITMGDKSVCAYVTRISWKRKIFIVYKMDIINTRSTYYDN